MSTDIVLNEESENYIGGLLNSGEKINGYTIIGKLDTSSGEGEIYYCEKDSKRYILKYYYRKNIFSDLQKNLKSINHKNVMKILDAGTYKKHSYEIDEYYDGGTLVDIQLPLSEKEVFDIIEQLNEGLKAIHSSGIIHRDIKAENIYFKDSSRKEIVIGDFGIATVYDQKDDVNEHLTTIDSSTDGYKAPEAFNGVISPSIDYYSLGITVWNILTGKTPFVEASGEPYPSGKIKYETINEKIKDDLLSQSPELSERAKKLISGLLVYRHDQRWRYEEVKDFLSGKDVPVFTERRELSAFEFDNKEFFNLKDLAEALLQNKTKGIELLKGTQLTRYLDNNDLGDRITPVIEKIQNEYFSDTIDNNSFDLLGGIEDNVDREEYGLIKAAFALCSNITFPLSYYEETYAINDISDFTDLLRNHPTAIRPYLLTECYGLYVKLDAIAIDNNQESLSEKIKTIAENSKNTRTLPLSIYLGLTENKIKPFTDKINGNIELQSQDDVYALSDNLKERLMYLVDSKNKMIIAWLEAVFGVDMNEWYGELEGGSAHDEDIAALRRNKLLAFGKWKYFEFFLKGQDVIYRNKFLKDGKYGLLNLDGSVLLEAQFDDLQCIFIRNHYIYKDSSGWNVVAKIDDRNFENEIKCDKEIEVFNEEKNFYKTKDYKYNDMLVSKGSEQQYYCPIVLDKIVLGWLDSYNEINHPYERFTNRNGNTWELLDENFNVIDSFENIHCITAEGEVPEKLVFWVKKNSKVYTIDKNANVIESFTYTDFISVGNNCFIVTDLTDGKTNLVSYKNELICKNVKDYRSSGKVAAVQRDYKAKWELLNLANPSVPLKKRKYKNVGYIGSALFALNSYKKILFFTDDNDGIQTSWLSVNGNSCLLSNSKGIKKKFVAVNNMTIKKICNDPEHKRHYYILGFDGKMFFKYNFNTLLFEELYSANSVPEDELVDLLDNIDSKLIINLVKRHIAKKEYEKANVIINLTWNYYYQKNRYDEVRYLLSSIRMDKTDGLDLIYLAYKAYIGYTYLNENAQYQNSYKTADLLRRNRNFIFALHYLLSAAGKEVNERGEIITSPFLLKLQWNPQLTMDCAEVCIDISKIDHNLYLSYGWTKEYIKDVALGMMKELYNLYTDSNYRGNPYLELYNLARLYGKLEDYQTAIEIHKEAIPYEQGLSVMNGAQAVYLLYGTNQYQEAMSVYEQLSSMYLDFGKDQPELAKIYQECKTKLHY